MLEMFVEALDLALARPRAGAHRGFGRKTGLADHFRENNCQSFEKKQRVRAYRDPAYQSTRKRP